MLPWCFCFVFSAMSPLASCTRSDTTAGWRTLNASKVGRYKKEPSQAQRHSRLWYPPEVFLADWPQTIGTQTLKWLVCCPKKHSAATGKLEERNEERTTKKRVTPYSFILSYNRGKSGTSVYVSHVSARMPLCSRQKRSTCSWHGSWTG